LPFDCCWLKHDTCCCPLRVVFFAYSNPDFRLPLQSSRIYFTEVKILISLIEELIPNKNSTPQDLANNSYLHEISNDYSLQISIKMRSQQMERVTATFMNQKPPLQKSSVIQCMHKACAVGSWKAQNSRRDVGVSGLSYYDDF